MKKITIAFLYNVRHNYPDPNDPRTQLESDFDDPETTNIQIKYLRSCGYMVIPIEADENAYFKLKKHKKNIDLAFNVSEGIYGNDRESQLPAILEMLQIPYTGSPPLAQALVLDKAKTKEVLIANNIATLPFQLFKTGTEKLKKNLHFPLIVKPLSEGSSAGITNKSVVNDEKQLRKQLRNVLSTFHEPALVEHFLQGQEFSIAMIGNPPRILPIISPDHTKLPKKYLPLDSFEVKWVFEENGGSTGYLTCPAIIERKLRHKIEKLSLRLWDALNMKDWCRIDIRCDLHNKPYVLEVNSPPGVMPPEMSVTSYFPLAARKAGIEYKDLLKLVINTALKRYSK